jgi:tetratricopeptide (TPR) repeat protein
MVILAIEPKLVMGDESMYEGSRNREAVLAYNNGVIALGKNDPVQGVASLKRAVELDPQYVKAWDELGLCYRRIKDYNNAAACYKRSIDLYPNGPVAHLDLAVLYGYLNRKEDQIAEYNIVKNIDPENPESYYGLAIALLENGNFQEAIQNAESALNKYKRKNDPNSIDAEILLSKIYYAEGNTDKAHFWSDEASRDKGKYR